MTKHVMLELSTAHLSGETLDALNMGSIESVISYDKTVGWLGTVGYFVPITGLEENLERYRAQLEFDDIYKKGYKNVSVFESVKQTIEDKDFSEFLASNPIYTIYVKALPK